MSGRKEEKKDDLPLASPSLRPTVNRCFLTLPNQSMSKNHRTAHPPSLRAQRSNPGGRCT